MQAMLSFLRRRPSRPKGRQRTSFRPRLDVLEDRCLLSGGVLDPTFGSSGGLVNTTIGSGAQAFAVATYPNEGTANDGKIVAVGDAVIPSHGHQQGTEYVAVVRYNRDGSLDPMFGGSGEVGTKATGTGMGVAVQPDGKVVIADWGSGAFTVLRYNADGTPDATFGSAGQVNVKFSKSSTDDVYNVALQADGKIVAVGETNNGGSTWDLGLVRFNSNGSLDASFGTGGKVVTQFASSLSQPIQSLHITSLAIDPNTSPLDPNSGKLIVATRDLDGASAGVVRYNTNGSLDTGFGGAGYVLLSGPYNPAVAVESDDRIVVAGTNPGIVVDRLNADGTLDASFGTGGTVVAPPPSGDSDAVSGVAIQSGGKIVVGGSQSPIGVALGDGLMAARFNADGSLDAAFGIGGFTATAPGTGQGEAMALEPDGRIVVAGRNFNNGMVLARFVAYGPQVGSFTASPNPVTAGSSLTLTASSISDEIPSATVSQVAFYVSTGGTNTLLGDGTQSSTGVWTLTFTVNLAPGTYTLFTQAEDNYGIVGDLAPLTLTVQ
jgi:uncharacterized delta-60 repeat protein